MANRLGENQDQINRDRTTALKVGGGLILTTAFCAGIARCDADQQRDISGETWAASEYGEVWDQCGDDVVDDIERDCDNTCNIVAELRRCMMRNGIPLAELPVVKTGDASFGGGAQGCTVRIEPSRTRDLGVTGLTNPCNWDSYNAGQGYFDSL
ncbi:MAG: hypothetical protein ACD_51C00021G0008 [uncultured bacterium]|nr:MAG: hypothetical protein ACD_51C00021G0008 [uncultured bacterium]OGJ47579.1 MAG: hypothetical protein A2244_00750 [Candidatus Peregrinibacteria bacterium RIFOXYA2_FULL_41_18]OGJ49620.1 MAG: hypothetical protein A2344_02360 [Candidatus Peregrinibacteria bacterium RIFOXYB12_FULL_41_12]OGJ53140.1 MAG: hypothetical protein A2448_03135 [Candidatus Peregrinibacteria bacterium RIFOXYC2_FULL_41_22]OGJ54427.1 MAG: hypothetical protein A2336_01275 [Candidatus Peregrinibacteria bacterium RIFOXYB2_FULL